MSAGIQLNRPDPVDPGTITFPPAAVINPPLATQVCARVVSAQVSVKAQPLQLLTHATAGGWIVPL